MRILFTGGSGLLALNWAALVRRDHDVMLATNRRSISLSNVGSSFLDLSDMRHINSFFDEFKPELVVHAAGLTNVDLCNQQPELAYFTNVILAKNIATACGERNISLIHVSTDHLFNDASPFKSESHQINPINIYALTKAEAEREVLKSCNMALVIRTNFFGWGTGYRISFSDWVINSLRELRYISLYDNIFYTPILISELVYVINELVNAKRFGIYNIVGDERISKYEFGIKLADIFDLDRKYIKSDSYSWNKSIAPRAFEMSLSNDKATHAIGRPLGGLVDYLKKLNEQNKNGLRRELQLI